MIKVADMPIYGKNTLKVFYPGTSGLMSMKLGMKPQILNSITLCSNDNRGLILTCIMASVKYAT